MFIPTNLHTTSIFFFFNDTATTEIYTLSLTRRSSDLLAPMEIVEIEHLQRQFETNLFGVVRVTQRVLPERSEEHTSELQSRLHLVCRLLLEKKKKSDPDR